jgi:hypothetical protein
MFLLYYACTKLGHYLLSSNCIVIYQTDVIKHMLHKPISSGRLGKWAYSLIGYDLVEHWIDIEHDLDVSLILLTPWKLDFDGSTCSNGQGIKIIFISPSGAYIEMSSRLEYFCTNNQVEYEALLFGLEILESMVVKHVEVILCW